MAARPRGSMGRERALLCVYVKLLANQTCWLGKMRYTVYSGSTGKYSFIDANHTLVFVGGKFLACVDFKVVF